METLAAVAFSLSVLVGATGVMGWHVRQWRRAQGRALEKAELDYRRSQFRRRMQTTALFALATAALPFGLPLTRVWPQAGAVYWGVVVLLLLWAIVLGFADILAIKVFYGRLHHRNQLEQARLELEIRRIQSGRSAVRLGQQAQGNGHGPSPHAGNGGA